MTEINCSIVICTYNQRSILEKVLGSIRRQIRTPRNFEIIIADDHSSDETEHYIKGLRFPIFLKYIRSQYQSGRAENRNRGFEKAVGQWIICIDGDMAPDENLIETYLSAFEKFDNSVFIGSVKNPKEWGLSRFEKYIYTRGRLSSGEICEIPGKYFTTNNFAIKREVFLQSAGFDTQFKKWGGEDTDFGLRLEKAGFRIRYLPQATCYHFHRRPIDRVIEEYQEYGRYGVPILTSKHQDMTIFKNGWMLGLPSGEISLGKKLLSNLLRPLRSPIILKLLHLISRYRSGALLNDIIIDWLLYGHLALGYGESRK